MLKYNYVHNHIHIIETMIKDKKPLEDVLKEKLKIYDKATSYRILDNMVIITLGIILIIFTNKTSDLSIAPSIQLMIAIAQLCVMILLGMKIWAVFKCNTLTNNMYTMISEEYDVTWSDIVRLEEKLRDCMT